MQPSLDHGVWQTGYHEALLEGPIQVSYSRPMPASTMRTLTSSLIGYVRRPPVILRARPYNCHARFLSMQEQGKQEDGVCAPSRKFNPTEWLADVTFRATPACSEGNVIFLALPLRAR